MSRETKVLIIDDNKEIVYAIQAIITYKNWTALTALSGKEGIECVKAHEPDIVLLDYNMPGLNGIQTAMRIREISATVPIIVLTVEERQDIADRFMEAGASDFALKPIRALDLIARISVHLKMKDLAAEQNEAEEIPYTKGISPSTMGIILKLLRQSGQHQSIADVSQKTGLSYQTVHRYVQHLLEAKKVEMEYDYGKRGRPTQSVRWIQD